MGLTEVACHHRGGGAAVARRFFDGDDASLRPTTTQPGSWGPERESTMRYAILAMGGRAAELTEEMRWRRLLGNFW
jgi:hypothetical protein